LHRPFSAHRSLWAYLWRGIKISIVLMIMLPVFCGVQVYRSGAAALPQDYSGDAAVVRFGEAVCGWRDFTGGVGLGA